MIRKLSVKNYKSLRSVDILLRPLTVFVGPNNAGKSNIFDALLVISELVNVGGSAIYARGGFEDIVWNGELNRTVSIAIEGELPKPPKRKYVYELDVVGGPQQFSAR